MSDQLATPHSRSLKDAKAPSVQGKTPRLVTPQSEKPGSLARSPAAIGEVLSERDIRMKIDPSLMKSLVKKASEQQQSLMSQHVGYEFPRKTFGVNFC
ncbi:hypothetical protein Y032_0520g2847 [Ancylostoma ceylanicum]|uniref:Uncharacterized protein n=1 Tax=Ancylostoma ceylanicum TaxID=53326 RepID=A0A016WSU3_9BILA|nr:hypothetical protein Y032_0520g2847 [Ancylostoma ceylanicum]